MDNWVVKAEEFVLVDAKGRTLATLARDHYGGVTLSFFDEAGAKQCMVGVDHQGTPLITLGDAREPSFLYLSKVEQSTGFKVMDKEGDVYIQVGVDGISNQAFVMRGSTDNTHQLALLANEDGSTSVILYDGQGTSLMAIQVHPNGSPALLVEQVGHILTKFGPHPIQSTHDADSEREPSQKAEVEVPSEEATPRKLPDAWDKVGIVYCD